MCAGNLIKYMGARRLLLAKRTSARNSERLCAAGDKAYELFDGIPFGRAKRMCAIDWRKVLLLR